MRAWMLMGLAISCPAAAADQFDLFCKGVDNIPKPRNVIWHYRLDLKQRKLCWQTCSAGQEHIARVEQAFLILMDSETRKDGMAILQHDTVNRITGQWRNYLMLNGKFQWDISGTCRPARFSGFPPVVTKF